jgi:invasion protein IalB
MFARLSCCAAPRICLPMRAPFFIAPLLTALALLPLAGAAPVLAQTKHASPAKPAASSAPKQLGKFEDWIAATHQEGGQKVCYAFTRPQNSTPALPGRGEVVLTVTQRPTGRDAVALSAGFPYAPGVEVMVQVDQTGHPFYTSQRSAFSRQGTAAVGAMKAGRTVIARSPGPNKGQVVDTFSLKGFAQAYAATVKECPPSR